MKTESALNGEIGNKCFFELGSRGLAARSAQTFLRKNGGFGGPPEGRGGDFPYILRGPAWPGNHDKISGQK